MSAQCFTEITTSSKTSSFSLAEGKFCGDFWRGLHETVTDIREREKHYYPLTVLDKVSPLTFISAVLRQALTNVSNSESETKKQIDVHSSMSVCTIHEHNLIHLKLHL